MRPRPQDQDFDFEAWMRLARSDPEGFEARRRQLIEAHIAARPPEDRERLRRLQWRIDREIQRHGNPLGACVHLHRWMFDSLARQQQALETLLNGASATPRQTARVVPLRPQR
ncbi:DUF3135 domain-containing protein [Methylomarinovum tepidoasis]|nr:DUF3135 domain-containing protein [Methylomarinovum sp. IN45]